MNSIWALNQLKQKGFTRDESRGFTIVELLIVIVIIGILAAITIVAYNGISNRSKEAAAESAASSAVKKAGAFQSETGNLPLASTDLTGAATTTSYNLTGVTFQATLASAPTAPATLVFRKCGTGAPANQAALVASNTTGIRMVYWDYPAGSENGSISTGNVSGAGVTCPTS